MRLFVDTSALIASLDPTQARHGELLATIENLSISDEFVITEIALSEAIAIIQRRYGRDGLSKLERYLRRVTVTWIDRALFERAFVEAVAAGGASFVDRTSFAFMRASGIDIALTLDGGFRDAGFKSIP